MEDELRYGLMSNYRRSWSKKGVRAVVHNQQQYANAYCYSAVSPLSGDSFHLTRFHRVEGSVTKLFLIELKKQHPNDHVVVVWDNAPFHRPKYLREIPGMTIVALPPYSPQLSPAERFFEEVRKATANETFRTLADQEATIEANIKELAGDSARMRQLCGYAWIREQYEMVF